jgi:alkylated DNA repair dioxygenase AlkB
MPALTRAISAQNELFAAPSKKPVGLCYQEDIISLEEERTLVEQFKALPFKPFEFHGFLGKRRVVSFGWRYDFAGRTLRNSDPIPDFLQPLQKKAANIAGAAADSFQQVLINEYEPGAGIGWHRDKPMFQQVVGFSFGGPCTMRFRLKRGLDWRRASLNVYPRSAYLLDGPARWDWEHSIPPPGELRYSVTLRNFVGSLHIGRENSTKRGGNAGSDTFPDGSGGRRC